MSNHGNGKNGNGKAKLIASAFLAKGTDDKGRSCVRKDEQGHWQDQVLAIFQRDNGFGQYLSGKLGLGDKAISVAIRAVYAIFTIPPKDEQSGKRDYAKERLMGVYEEVTAGDEPWGKTFLVKGGELIRPVTILKRLVALGEAPEGELEDATASSSSSLDDEVPF